MLLLNLEHALLWECLLPSLCAYYVLYVVVAASFQPIDIESHQNRLLKVCYVPASGASLNRLLFAASFNSTDEAKKAGSMRR
jgi:hypothetical protein